MFTDLSTILGKICTLPLFIFMQCLIIPEAKENIMRGKNQPGSALERIKLMEDF